MSRRRMKHRHHMQLEELLDMAAPGCLPWLVDAPACPAGKRRWPTERAANVALHNARQSRLRRGRGIHRGKLESRAYACALCDGFHLTSMSADEYEARSTSR